MRYPMPRPVLDEELPPKPELLRPIDQPQVVCDAELSGQWWRAVLRKVSYGVASDGSLHRVSEQTPVHQSFEAHEPLPDWLGRSAGRKGSMKTVPDMRVSQSGTDVVVRGHAASNKPVREMLVGVVLGRHMHRLRVFGERQSQWVHGGVQFSEPEWFERMPLRYELAYGGSDAMAVQRALDRARREWGEDHYRRSSAFLKDHLPFTPPLAYARNPVGLGYVADAVPEALHGVSLPRMELAHDLLTPQRFAAGQPMRWLQRPVPAGMDFMDWAMFPRSAMLGLPPLGFQAGDEDEVAEVAWGQVPRQFCRGNLASAEGEAASFVPHPERVRSAPMGLRVPMARGTETLSLIGMRADRERWDIRLPAERPVFDVPDQGSLHPALWQVFVDVDAQRVELLWGAAWKADRKLHPFEDREVLQGIRMRGEVLS